MGNYYTKVELAGISHELHVQFMQRAVN